MAIIIRTVVPLILLISAGYLSRKIGILKNGDERVLSAYVFYFALPALFFIDMAGMAFNAETLKFMLSAVIPILLIVLFYVLCFFIFRLKRETLYLLILTTVFGSFAFFGIPFIMFAFPSNAGESLAVLSSASISIISVMISVGVFEIIQLERNGGVSVLGGVGLVAKRLSRNPLVLSIVFGVLLSVFGIAIFQPLADALRMLGRTTATVANFMLGVFLFGRKYGDLFKAFLLGLLRMLVLPFIALIFVLWFGLPQMQGAIVVLMHAMPLAVSMVVLSERYDFHKETIASVILITSLGSIIYLNLWIYLLGVR